MSISFAESLLIAGLGVLVVFVILIILMTSVNITSKIVGSRKKSEKGGGETENAAETERAGEILAAESSDYFSGSLGEVKTFSVPDRTAAMIMAVVADQSGLPLEQLKFKSIKEISE